LVAELEVIRLVREATAKAVLSADPRRASQSRRDRSQRFLDILARSFPDLGGT